MDRITQHLVELSNKLDQQGYIKCADAIDSLIKDNSMTKVAQYVGAIGYVLKQNRAIGNCIRKKRVASSESMQNVILSCLKEYQDGQEYGHNEWTSKYAQIIQKFPTEFDSAHLNFLSVLAETNDLAKHIENVQTVSDLLTEHSVEDPMLKQVLSHIETFGNILQKESETTENFKLAALPSGRSFWSRFWNPSEFNAVNPLSWKGRWQRGQDLDTMNDMTKVLESIREITSSTQNMRTDISRLKHQVAGYLSGSHKDLPQTESVDTINTVVQKINELDPNDWNKSVLAAQQLQHLLRETNIANSYNKQHLDIASDLANNLSENINNVYDSTRQVQVYTNLLRQRTPIRGRYPAINEQGKKDPRAIASPAEEFGALEQVLNKLYENPFDQKSQQYALRLHARLDDKLRYITHAEDPEIKDWLSQEQQSPQANSIDQNTDGEINQPAEVTTNKNVDKQQIDEVAQSLLDTNFESAAESDTPQDKAKWIVDLLTQVFATLGVTDDPRIKALHDKLIEVAQTGNVAPETAAPVQQSTTQSPQQAAQSVVPDSDTEEEWSKWFSHSDEWPDENTRTSFNINDLIKIADTIDKWNVSAADLIDKYIEENKPEEPDKKIDFSEITYILQEYKGKPKTLYQ